MSRQFNYNCTKCGVPSTREELTTKTAVFKETGLNGKVLRQRVMNWLCKDCLQKDEHYNSPERSFVNKVAADVSKESLAS